jgi:hypothetical protein
MPSMSIKNGAITLPGSCLWIVSGWLHSCVHICFCPDILFMASNYPHSFCCQDPYGLLHELLNHRALFDVAITQISHASSPWCSQWDTAELMVCRSVCAVFLPHTFIVTLRNLHPVGDSAVAICCFAFSQMLEADTSSFHKYALQH